MDWRIIEKVRKETSRMPFPILWATGNDNAKDRELMATKAVILGILIMFKDQIPGLLDTKIERSSSCLGF